MIFIPHSCCWLRFLARQHHPTHRPPPAPSGAPGLPGRGAALGPGPGLGAERAGVPRPSPAGEMPLGWAGNAGRGSGEPQSPWRARRRLRAPSAPAPSRCAARQGLLPADLLPQGTARSPVSQKCLLSAAACQPGPEMISRSIGAGTALWHGREAPGRSLQCSRPEKASGRAGDSTMEATGRWTAGYQELRGQEKPGRAGKSYRELPLPAHRHLQKQQPAHRSCRGRKGWEVLFLSWLSRSWQFHNKLH